MSTASEKLIAIDVITDWRDFDLLKNDWQALLKQSDADNIFLTWQWIDCWRKSQANTINPLIIVIKEAQETIAIAPFYLQPYRLVGAITYHALRFVGDKGTGSEYSNFIVRSEDAVKLKARLWEQLLSSELKGLWDFVWFTNVSAWTEGGKSLVDALASVKSLNYYQRSIEFAQTPLDGDIFAKLSANQRANIRKPTKKLKEIGSLDMALTDQDEDLTEHLEKLFNLHNQRWQEDGLGSFQRRSELVDFYRFFVPVAFAKGWLRLLRLESNNEIQAMQLGYVYNNHFLSIQEGFNPDFIPGIGQVLRLFSFNNCQKESLDCYDFLGMYSEHKRRWLAEKRFGTDLFICQKKVKNTPFLLAEIWPTGRYLKPSTPLD